MAIAIYSVEELKRLAGIPNIFIIEHIKRMSLKRALLLRRNLQISLSAYSTKNPARDGKFDAVHDQILWVCGKIEKLARKTYLWHLYKEVWPSAKGIGLSKAAFKLQAANAWENFLRKTGY